VKRLENFRHTLLSHFGALIAIILGMMTFVGFVGWWQGEQWRVLYASSAIVHGLYWIVILYLAWVVLNRKTPDFIGNPTIKSVYDRKILIVEDAPWLSLGVMVAIYTKEDQFERLVCVGEVINVQTNNLIQIAIRDYEEVFGSVEAVCDKLDKMSKSEILIRPGLFRRIGE
jgi:hypothetical protein